MGRQKTMAKIGPIDYSTNPRILSMNDNYHMLQDQWTLWYTDYNNKNTDGNGQNNWKPIQLASFTTVEEFWYVITRVKSPSSIQPKVDFMIFRSGIEPCFEHDKNQYGGSWKMILDKKHNRMAGLDRSLVDKIWLETIMLLIGETFLMNKKNYVKDKNLVNLPLIDDSKTNISAHANGCFLQIRPKEDRIAIWTSLGMNKAERERKEKQSPKK